MGDGREKRDINIFNSLVMRCLEKVERKQGDRVKFRLFVKLIQETPNFEFKVVFFIIYVPSLFHHSLVVCFYLS